MSRVLAIVILAATTVVICCFLYQSVSDADKRPVVIVSTVALALGIWNLVNQLLIRAHIRVSAVYLQGTAQMIGSHTYPFVIVFHNAGDQVGVVRIKNCYFGTKTTIMDSFRRKDFYLKYFERKEMEKCNYHAENEWIAVEPHRIALAKVKVECHKAWNSIGFHIEFVGKHGKRQLIYLNRRQVK